MNILDKRVAVKAGELAALLQSKYPALLRPRAAQPAPTISRSAIVLGREQSGSTIMLPQRARMEHVAAIGTTGGGKSNLLAHCIRQDIANGCGVFVADPHGEHPASLYRTTLAWLDRAGYASRRTIHLIDPNAATHTVGFNPLARSDAETDVSVIAGATLEAFSRAWGGEDTAQKPTIERVLTATFSALVELGLTLAEAPLLLDRKDQHGLRRFAIDNVADRYTRDELQRLHELSLDERRRHDFDLEVVGPINRLARFVRPAAIRAMIGQSERLLDIRAAMDEGHIILCNLSGGSRVYEKDADLLGRLLTRALFFHAKRRRAPDRPFFVYLDECHRYLSGDLESILAEIRKYGVSTCLSFQWLGQLEVESENMLAAVRNATNVKIIFRLKDPKEAEDLAQAVIPLDLEIPVRKLVKPTVVGHRRIRLLSDSASEQSAIAHSVSETQGESESHTVSYAESVGITEGQSEGLSDSEGLSSSEAISHATASGSAASSDFTSMLTPAPGLFGPATVVGLSQGVGSSSNSSQSSGSTRGSGKSSSTGRTTGSSRAVTNSSTWGESTSHATSRATSVGRSESRGSGRTEGSAEGLEPILADLPSAVHSKDAVLYMAAQTLRNLSTGQAVMNYVGESGMMSAMLNVPKVSEIILGLEAFAVLRERILSGSSAAIPMQEACALIDQREARLLALNRNDDEEEPTNFRTKAPPAASKRAGAPQDAASRRHTRPASKRKRSGR